MMKRFLSVLVLSVMSATAQLTPAQLEANSARFNSVSQRQLIQDNTYLLSLLIGGSALTPTQLASSANAFNVYSDRMLQQSQTYLLSLIQSGPVTPYGTNFVKVSTTNDLITAVNVNAVPGQTIYMAPGTYNIGTNVLVVPDNVNLIGPGHDQVNIIGYSDCAAHEFAAGAPTGGPQIHPGNNSIIQGFTITCDTNSLVAATAAGKHSGSWAGIGVSYLNPPTTTSFTNTLWKDIWGFEGYFDIFHLNPSNRCEVRIEDCRGEAQGGIFNFVSAFPERTNTYRMERCVGISHGVVPSAVANAGYVTGDFFLTFDQTVTLIDCSAFCVSNVVGGVGSAVFNAWSGSTSNLAVVNGGYYFTTSTTDTTWNASSVVGSFTSGTINSYPTNVYRSVPFNFPIAANASIASLQANKASLITSNIAVSPWLFTNNLTYNIQTFISGAGGGSNSIAVNGTFIGYMTNGCTVTLQPGEFLWNTNGAAHPNFSFKPF